MNKKRKTYEINKQKPIVTENNQLSNLIKIFAIVTALFIVFLGITTLVTKDKTTDNNTDTPATSTIQYDEILVGDLLKQSPSSYYVLAVAKSDINYSLYNYYASQFSTKIGALTMFIVDLDNAFNKPYIGDTAKLNVANISDIKFKDAVLLLIKDKKIINRYETKTAIMSVLAN